MRQFKQYFSTQYPSMKELYCFTTQNRKIYFDFKHVFLTQTVWDSLPPPLLLLHPTAQWGRKQMDLFNSTILSINVSLRMLLFFEISKQADPSPDHRCLAPIDAYFLFQYHRTKLQLCQTHLFEQGLHNDQAAIL